MAATRGCVNNRCWVQVDDAAFMLDELGVHRFSGTAQVDQVSQAIQTLFRSDASDNTQLRINWTRREFFHASIDPARETIRWHVCMDGSNRPRHAICLQYRTGHWAIEENGAEVGGACLGYVNGFTPQVFYGCANRKVGSAWTGSLDFADPAKGTVQSTVTSATAFTLTDTAAAFGNIANTPVAIVYGTGKGQTRKIISVNGTTLNLDSPWAILPDATSIYQIGGVHWLFRSAWFRISPSERMAQRRFEMLFEPLKHPATASLRFFDDFSSEPTKQARTERSADGDGIESKDGDGDLIVDLTRKVGWVDRQLPGGKDFFAHGRIYTQYEIEGFQGVDIVKVYQLLYEGIVPEMSQGE
jgi:hypothetical protein